MGNGIQNGPGEKKFSTATKEERLSSDLTSQGTPVMNLLSEFKAIQNDNGEETAPFNETPEVSSTTHDSFQATISNILLGP